MNKQSLLLALAQKRKATHWPEYSPIGDYHDGVYECDFVSPYTKTAGNVDADIMVMLQDWSSARSLEGPLDLDCVRYGLTRTLPTNRRLAELLQSYFQVGLGDVYATNLFPFIKAGGISSSIPVRDLVRAAQEFALPQIRIVQPKLVVCLGLNTFNALSVACSHTPAQRIEGAIASPFTIDATRVWCQAHTGARGQNNRGRERVSRDWRKMELDFSRGVN
jgi:restriction system protein